MARLIVSMLTSLDNYCAGPGGRLDDLPMGEPFMLHNLDLMRSTGTMIFGAVTFPMFEAYWPTVDRGPAGDPVQREVAQRVQATRKLVVSDRLVVAPSSPWRDAEVVRRDKAHDRIAAMKAEPGDDLVIFGSHILVNDLLAHGLVDEFHHLVANVLLGGGRTDIRYWRNGAVQVAGPAPASGE